MTMETLNLLTFVAIALCWFIAIVNMAWVSSFYILRKEKEIRMRRPAFSVLIGVLCILSNLITHPSYLFFGNITIIPVIPHRTLILMILTLITDAPIMFIITFRGYMVYFDIKWNNALQDQKWRLHINQNETNWFLKYKNTFGNSRKIAIILFFHWFIIGFLMMSSVALNQWNESQITRIFMSLHGIVPVVYEIILLCKFPKYEDVWYIAKEAKLSLKLGTASVVSFFLIGFFFKLDVYTYTCLVFFVIQSLVYFCWVAIVCYYPLKKHKLATTPCFINKSLMTTLQQLNSSSQDNQQQIGLKNVMENEYGFNAFARYLSSEFCIENYLFFIETQQWLLLLSTMPGYEYIQKLMTNAETNEGFLNITFPESAPKSTILNIKYDQCIQVVVDENECGLPSNTQYLQCVKIFQKYITYAAYFCINISGEERETLYTLFGYSDDNKKDDDEMVQYLRKHKVSKQQLASVFDAARYRTFLLLLSAFSRFKRSNEFEKLSKTIELINCNVPKLSIIKRMD